MSLLELIESADERALAASAVACLDRCLPLLTGPDGPEPLRPLWASCENGRDWAIRLAAVRTELDGAAARGGADGDGGDDPAARVRAMLAAAPPTSPPRRYGSGRTPARWSRWRSMAGSTPRTGTPRRRPPTS